MSRREHAETGGRLRGQAFIWGRNGGAGKPKKPASDQPAPRAQPSFSLAPTMLGSTA